MQAIAGECHWMLVLVLCCALLCFIDYVLLTIVLAEDGRSQWRVEGLK